MVSQSAQVASVDNGVLMLAFDNSALAGRFGGSQHAENVALAVRETLGLQVRVEATTGPVAAPTPRPTPSSAPAAAPSAGYAAAAAAVAAAPSTPAPSASAPSASSFGGSAPEPEEPPYDDSEYPEEEIISEDDERAPDAQLSGADVVAKMLGGTIVEDA